MLTSTIAHYPIQGTFTISRGSKGTAAVIKCLSRQGSVTGKGECVPYSRYGESLSSVEQQIAAIRPLVEAGAAHAEILAAMQPGAARNAVDCALWDMKAKTQKMRVAAMLGIEAGPVVTAFTLSLDTADAMYRQARKNAACPLLKIKAGRQGDAARMRAVRAAAPAARLIVDANEGWDQHNLAENIAAARACGVSLIEQPLPAGEDECLKERPRDVLICADESLHTADDLERIYGLYDAVNIKLDKTGGLTEALRLKKLARQQGFQIMVGCMVASSLAMAPAVFLAQDADFVDLDGPLLLQHDCAHGLHYED